MGCEREREIAKRGRERERNYMCMRARAFMCESVLLTLTHHPAE